MMDHANFTKSRRRQRSFAAHNLSAT